MRQVMTACVLVVLAACAPGEDSPGAAQSTIVSASPPANAPAGIYRLDPTHASVVFRVSHLGLSRYTARFTRFDAELDFDPANLAASSVTATIDARSIETDYPGEDVDFDAMLQNEDWLHTAPYPEIAFRSTGADLTGPNTLRVTGELTLHGVTRPVTLDASFNGGYARQVMDPSGSRIGFSARGSLKRSDFDIDYGLPKEGSTFGVGDTVEFLIEAEFTRPRPEPAGGAAGSDGAVAVPALQASPGFDKADAGSPSKRRVNLQDPV